jgi:UDP-N-acetylglucosamine:LPS N-acetylglucosamine transferase
MPQATMTADKLAGLLTDFLEQRGLLEAMAARAQALALPDAARRVAALILQAAGIDRHSPDAGAAA